MLGRIEILGSSSKGNCYKLIFDNGKKIILDAGLTDNDKMDIECVFITHKHGDHIKELDFYKSNNLPIIEASDQVRFRENESLKWTSFIVPHAVLNNGYIINYDNETIGYITDCGDYEKIDLDLSNLTYLLIECNWDYFLINQNVIKAKPYSLYAFSKEGHMSNLDTLNAIAKWKVNKNCKIVFIHKSQEHANYETTYKMFESLPHKWYVAKDRTTIFCKSWKIY